MIRSISLDSDRTQVLLSNDLGDYAILSAAEYAALTDAPANLPLERQQDLESRSLWPERSAQLYTPLETAAYHTRKSFALEGPSLHIFVVTLRCDHSCQYCQVSRANVAATGFDMTHETAALAVERVFEAPSPVITIEFQGGEPAFRFDLVRHIVTLAEERNATAERTLNFTMVSTLHHLSDDDFAFCRDHSVKISTSIDGPAHIHNANRPNPSRDAWQKTIAALEHARLILGIDAISALPTLTRAALSDPQGLIDHYRELGFPSIFLRPISPYGFAQKTQKAIGYTLTEYLKFYDAALTYILELNAKNEAFEETYSAILLRHILTPFHSGYMDLRSPTGAGFGVLLYNYDGRVFPADEARMAAETGDTRFVMGTVADSFDTLMSSEAMRWLSTGAVAESLPGCRDCAFVPYCGSDPVYHATVQGDPAADRLGTEFCQKHQHIFRALFTRIATADPETMRTFTAWAMRRPRELVPQSGWIDR